MTESPAAGARHPQTLAGPAPRPAPPPGARGPRWRGGAGARPAARRAGHAAAAAADTARPRGSAPPYPGGSAPPYLAAGRAPADADQEGLAAAGLLVALQGLLAVPRHGSRRPAPAACARPAARCPLPAARPAPGRCRVLPPPAPEPVWGRRPGAAPSRARRGARSHPRALSVMPPGQSGGRRAAIRRGAGGGHLAPAPPRPPARPRGRQRCAPDPRPPGRQPCPARDLGRAREREPGAPRRSLLCPT